MVLRRFALLGLGVIVVGVRGRALAQTAISYELPPPYQGELAPRTRVPTPIPDGYHAEARSHRGLLVTGGLLFGLSYAGSFLAGVAIGSWQSRTDAQYGTQTDKSGVLEPAWLLLPVVGPFGAMADMGKVESGLLWAGIAQAAGSAMLITGIAWKRTVLVPNTSARVTLTPAFVGAAGQGIALVGTFP